MLSDKYIRAGLDHACFMHPEPVKSEGVLWIEIPPNVVPNFAQRLQRIVIARRVSPIDEQLRRALGLGYAEIDRLEDCFSTRLVVTG